MVKAHPSAAKVARRRDARLEPPPIIAQGERRSTSLERIRPQRIFAPGENRRNRKAPAKAGPRRAVRRTNSTSGAFGRWLAYVPNEFGLQGPSAGGRPAPTGKGFCVGGGRRLARSAWEGRFQSAQKPSAGGRHTCRMNSASRGLRPAVGLRRPGGFFCVGGGRRLARSALRGRFQSAQKPSAGGRPARRMNSASRGLRPAVGLRRPGGFFCVGGGRRLARSAWEGRFQSAQKPSADGRPAPTGRYLLRRRRPTLGAQRLEGPISNRRRSLRPMVGLRRPGGFFCVGEGRRPARQRLEGPISNRRKSLRPMVGLHAE
jgi:hypothetical protein